MGEKEKRQEKKNLNGTGERDNDWGQGIGEKVIVGEIGGNIIEEGGIETFRESRFLEWQEIST